MSNSRIADTITGRSEVPGSSMHLRIQFDSHDNLVIPVGVWVEESLKIGMAVDAVLLERLKRKAKESEASEVAFRFLRFKPRTVQEVLNRLEREGFEPDISRQVIDSLSALGYLDDTAFTQQFISAYGQRMSRRELSYRLRQKGVDEGTATLQLAEEEALEQERSTAVRLARKHWRRNLHKPLSDRRTKLGNYLQSKGFALDIVFETIRLMEAEGEDGTHS